MDGGGGSVIRKLSGGVWVVLWESFVAKGVGRYFDGEDQARLTPNEIRLVCSRLSRTTGSLQALKSAKGKPPFRRYTGKAADKQ